jgi:hypothetical protein
MNITLRQLNIPHNASHGAIAEHVYQFLRRKCPAHYPQAWAHAPEPLRLALTLAVITGADHGLAQALAVADRKLDEVGVP